MKSNLKTRTGNKIVAVFDGKQIGLIQDVAMNDDYSPEPASGIGDIHVAEYVPTMARHVVNVSMMVLNKANMRQAGISAENGDAMLRGLVFDIEVIDRESGQLMRKYIGCSYASGNLDVRKHAIVTSNAVFNAIDVQSPNG